MAEGYKPTAGMKSAAAKAIKFKEEGKANGAGTAVGWTRARQLVNGETLSLDTVKRMYSFFSRHEVDKKGENWGSQSNPSNGYIMWLAWGGDAGFSWSRKIVNSQKDMKKSINPNDLSEEIKDMLNTSINKFDSIIEINDEETVQKSLRPEVTREQLYAVVEALHEVIEAILETPEEDDMETESDGPETEDMTEPVDANPAPVGDPDKNPVNWPVAKMDGQVDLEAERQNEVYKSDNEDEDKWDNSVQKCWTGYKQEGMKDKGGKMVPNCVPVEKAYDVEDKEEAPIKKSLFNNLDPYDLVKRKFSSKQREEMAASGHAMPDGSYPIGNKTDLMNAIRSWGRGGADPKVKSHIKRRAKELGLTNMIPENWK